MFGDQQNKEPKEVKEDSITSSSPRQEHQPNKKENHRDELRVELKDKMISIKESDYQKLVSELAEYKDKYMRLFAEFDNARKRMERERLDFVKYANEGLVSEFLGIMDDLERSIEAAKAKHEDYTAFLKGIEMVMAHIYEMLKKIMLSPWTRVVKNLILIAMRP